MKLISVFTQLSNPKLINKKKHLLLEFIIYWLLIAKFVIPIMCMDSFEPGKRIKKVELLMKRIKNVELDMPDAQVPIIRGQRCHKTFSSSKYHQVCAPS